MTENTTVTPSEYAFATTKEAWPRLKDGVVVTVRAKRDDPEFPEIWWATIDEDPSHAIECGGTPQEAIESLYAFLEGAISIYIDDPDDALTTDAIALRDWMQATFRHREAA